MKTYIIAAVLAAGTFSVSAQEHSDTLKVVQNAHSVVVTSNGNSSTISIVGSEDDKDFYYSHTTSIEDTAKPEPDDDTWGLSIPFLKEKPRKKSELIWFNQTYVGIVNPVSAPDGLDRSVECGFGRIAGISYKPWNSGPSFALGVGIHYEQYSLHRGQIFGKEQKRLTIEPLEEGMTDPSSRLRNFGFTIPFTVTQCIYDDFGITVGATLKFNSYTKATSTFHSGDVTYKRDFTGLQQRPLTFDIYGAIGWTESVGLYVRYTPVSLFKTADGPRFDTLSFGITIGM